MKKNLLTTVITISCILCYITNVAAQNISVVPNPTAADIFAWSGSGALSGYSGTPIVYKNSLVLEYNATSASDQTQIIQQLAVYTGSNSLTLIPNPDAGQGVYFQSVQLIFNDSLFFIYLDAAGVQRLASFDGTAITLYPNPDAAGPGNGYVGSPRIYNNSLYVAYVNAAGVTQFGRFNGSGISLIANPDASDIGFYNDYAAVFDNKICSRYIAADGVKHVAVYDGLSWSILPNPDNTDRGVVPEFPVVYDNKLYFQYFSAADQYQLLAYDGTNNPVLIANPQDGSVNEGGYYGLPLVLGDTLFFQYFDASSVLRLGKFDGTTESLVPNPDASAFGYYYTPIIYNNNLYIFYLAVDGDYHLARYVSDGDSLHVYPNPDAGLGYWNQPIVYNNKLYFVYNNAAGSLQLGSYDGGNSLSLVANPAGIYNGASGNNGYTGYPIIWNNILYMQFGSVPYGNAGNLASFNSAVLPVSLLSFTAKKDGSTSLLKWKTTNELNNAYFSIERSTDNVSYKEIGKINGRGLVSTEEDYSYTDNAPVKGMNYYRLKQVDADGHSTYTKTATVFFENAPGIFSVFPNPATDHVNITIPLSKTKAVIDIYNMDGKKLMEEEISAGLVSKTVDVNTLPAGLYELRLTQDQHQQTIKFLKK